MTFVLNIRKKINELVDEKLLNYAIVAILFAQFMILKWLHLYIYAGYLIDALIVGHIFLYFEKYDKKSLLFSFAVMIYILISFIILGGTLRNTIANLRDAFPALLIIPFVIYLIRNRKEAVNKVIDRFFLPINFYMVLNIIAIYFESKGHTWLSGIAYDNKNFSFTFPSDAMSGLFGIYGEPLLSLFICFLIIYNFKYVGKLLDKTKKILVLFWNIFLMVYSLYIASIYGINLHYVLLPMFVFVYFVYVYLSKAGISFKTLILIVIGAIVLLALVVFAYFKISFVNHSINYCFNKLFSGFDYKNAHGSSERLAMILCYLYDLNHVLGYGIGNARWAEKWTLGYHHFGISDFGTILCLGGIIIMILYSSIFFNLFRNEFRSYLVCIMLMLTVFVTMFATQIIFSISGITLFILISLVMYWNDEKNLN